MPTERDSAAGTAPLDRFDHARTTLATSEAEALSTQVKAHGAAPDLNGIPVASSGGEAAASPTPPSTDAYALIQTSTPDRGEVAASEETQTTVPATSDAAKRRGISRIRSVLTAPLARRDPRSYLLSPATLLTQRAEDFRQVRARMKQSLGDHGTVVVVSARHGEGRTITALNLGIAFAQQYERVVYVESDLRRPALHTFFDFEQGRGLSPLLQKDGPSSSSLDTALFRTDVPGFYLLPAGARSGPPEILDSPRMTYLAKQLALQADWIILDAPPLLTYAETQTLLGLADGVVVVALEGHTLQHDVQEVSLRLTTAGANVVGVTYLKHG